MMPRNTFFFMSSSQVRTNSLGRLSTYVKIYCTLLQYAVLQSSLKAEPYKALIRLTYLGVTIDNHMISMALFMIVMYRVRSILNRDANRRYS